MFQRGSDGGVVVRQVHGPNSFIAVGAPAVFKETEFQLSRLPNAYLPSSHDYEIVHFILQGGSPCIDQGVGSGILTAYTYVPTQTDLDSNSRVDVDTANNSIGSPAYVDMGAFKYQP